MAKRRLTSRQKRQRTRKIRNRVILTLALLSLASAAMAPELRAYLTAKIHSGVQAFADLRTSEIDLVLPEKKIALLQLGVFDNGESAQSERARLAGLGVPCAVWQDARMPADCGCGVQTGNAYGCGGARYGLFYRRRDACARRCQPECRRKRRADSGRAAASAG